MYSVEYQSVNKYPSISAVIREVKEVCVCVRGLVTLFYVSGQERLSKNFSSKVVKKKISSVKTL